MRPSQAYHAAINTATKIKHAQHVFKRAQEGIFHGRAIRFGNNVPESGQTTARTWMPNVQTRRIKSDILDRSEHFFHLVFTSHPNVTELCDGMSQRVL